MTRAKPSLRIVADPPIDIGALQRADIEARDWDAVHVAAEKRRPIDLPEQRRRGWLR